ncbi:MAG TPA: DUF6049 family protein [Acidimicrobiales bacterium]|nr:DUF6049 family protein [Acidimicrobiales bacterium]
MAAPAEAQRSPSGRIALASQRSWIGDGNTFVLRVDVDRIRSPQDLQLTATVHAAVTSRSQFARTVHGSLLGRRVARSTVPLRFDAAGAVPVVFSLPGAPDNVGAEPLPDLAHGVYPVAVSLHERGGPAIDSFTTHLVRVPSATDLPPLSVAWVLPLSAQPGLQPDGTTDLPGEDRRRLADVASALAGVSGAAVTLAPTPETLEALRTLGDEEALDDLRTTIDQGGQVIARSYVDLSLGTLLDPALADMVGAQRSHGIDIVDDLLGVRPDPRTFVTLDSLDDDDVTRLRRTGVDQLVVAEDELEPLPARVTAGLTLARPFLVEAGRGRRVVAAAAESGLAAHFSDGDDQVLAAHHLIADLAVIFGDRPGQVRGVVVHPPRDWEPDPTFLATVLTSISSIPTLAPVTVDELLADVTVLEDGGDAVVRQLTTGGAPSPGTGRDELDRLRRSVESLVTMTGRANPDVELLDQLLLVAESQRLDADRRHAYVTASRGRLGDVLDRIQVLDRGSYRLTAREGTIPLTLRNHNPYPVTVVLGLASDKLEFTEGDALGDNRSRLHRELTLEPGNTAVSLQVRTRTSGDFPLRIELRSVDGGLDVGGSRVTIRSTVASGVGVVLSVGAGLFLLVWWARHWRTARRDQRLVDPTADETA